LHPGYEAPPVGAFGSSILHAEQLFYVVPVPLSLPIEKCRKPLLKSGAKIIGECMRFRQASTYLSSRITADAKHPY
jgi:hypothetical protein